MSKRQCLSLLSAPQRSLPALQICSAVRPTTARGSPPPQCLLHRRQRQQPFSTTPHNRIGGKRMMTGKQKSQPSMSVQMKHQQAQAMRDGSILDMLGIMDNTFVPPSGKNLPSWFSDWRSRWKLQKYGFNSWLDGGAKAWFAGWWYVKPRPKMEKNKIPGIAKDLYEQMYNHFAAGTISQIEDKLAPGLAGSLRNRLSGRAPNTALLWTLHKYLGNPELMSFKFTVFPDGNDKEKMGIAQAVVKIKSKQSLQHVERKRTRDPSTGKEIVKEVVVDERGNAVPEEELENNREKSAKILTEYLVVQRHMKKSKFEPWHIWGTTEETSVAKMEKQEQEFEAKLKAQQRMKAAGQA